MMKKILLLLAVLAIIGTAFAYQAPLTDFDFASIENSTKNTTACKELTINLPQEAISEEGVGILSINATFTGDANDSTHVLVSINGGEEKIFWKENFSCTQQCWARVFVPEIKQGTTKINLCAVLGGQSEKLQINSDSFIGLYDTASLSIKNTAPAVLYLGDRAKMNISVSNTGTEAASIFVQFVHPDTRAKIPITSFDIVEGESSANTVIAPNETKQFTYYIKPSKLSSYNLPSAALFFKNSFGESQTLISNHPYLAVISQKPLEVSLMSTGDADKRTFKAIVKNNTDQLFSGTIMIIPQIEFEVYEKSVEVQPKSEQEITFAAMPLDQGKYSFFATIRDENQIYSSNQIEVEVTKQNIPVQIVLAIVGIIIGAAIFGWIYFSKEK